MKSVNKLYLLIRLFRMKILKGAEVMDLPLSVAFLSGEFWIAMAMRAM